MRKYQKKTEVSEDFANFLAVLNELPEEGELARFFDDLEAVGLDADAPESMERFESLAFKFMNGLPQSLVDYLARHSDRNSVYAWCDLLRSLGVQRVALKKVVRRFSDYRRRVGMESPGGSRERDFGAFPKLPFQSQPRSGALENWFEENEDLRFSFARRNPEKERELKRKMKAENYLEKPESISIQLFLSWDGERHLRFMGMPLLQLLGGGTDVSIERLGICPICRKFFYAKKLGAKRMSMTCGAKVCSDRLGNLRRKAPK